MGRRILSVLVAILFTVGAFAVPSSVAAKVNPGQTLTKEQKKKHKTKKSAKKDVKLSKKKSKPTTPSAKKHTKSKKPQSHQA